MNTNRIPVIGLTGGIGSGKSLVASVLARRGCVVADADTLAKQALDEPGVLETLRSRWGDSIVGDDGRADRQAIAGIIFQDDQQRAWLESILHPLVEDQRAAMFAAAPPETPALVIDAPLLLEAGLAERCDSILFVEAAEEARLERVQRDRSWDAAELARREAAQFPLDEKRSMAHHVLQNDGDVEDLARSVEDYLDTLISDQSS
ncbi:MAG: dephospho-CoA kinase [Phycisphaerales bacterium]|nr:dephospho-CoA kinase [Phycisphaerales bacterium]